MSVGELACTYAAQILRNDGIFITTEKINSIVKAANLKIDSYWPALFSKLLEKKSVGNLISNIGSGGVVHLWPPRLPQLVVVVSELQLPQMPLLPKEEPREEIDDDMGFSLFD